MAGNLHLIVIKQQYQIMFEQFLNGPIIFQGLLIFFARVCDVSIGTMRTIFTIQGRMLISFCLGIVELLIWIAVVSAVVNSIQEHPVLALFYAFGYATGNVVGIWVERKLAFGMMILRVITRRDGLKIAANLSEKGQPETPFQGEGVRGPELQLAIAGRRRDLKWILTVLEDEDRRAIYITEMARDVSKIMRPFAMAPTGWRAVLKRK